MPDAQDRNGPDMRGQIHGRWRAHPGHPRRAVRTKPAGVKPNEFMGHPDINCVTDLFTMLRGNPRRFTKVRTEQARNSAMLRIVTGETFFSAEQPDGDGL